MGASITIDCYANRVNTYTLALVHSRHAGQRGSSADRDPVYFGMVGLLKKQSELPKSDSKDKNIK